MGYLLNDNRASGGTLDEADTLACPHCQCVILKKKWRKKGGYCFSCDKPVCHTCFVKMQKHGCTPFLRQVDMALRGVPAYSVEDIVANTPYSIPRPDIKFFQHYRVRGD